MLMTISLSRWLCDGDGELLRADAPAGIGIIGHIAVGAAAQGNAVPSSAGREANVTEQVASQTTIALYLEGADMVADPLLRQRDRHPLPSR